MEMFKIYTDGGFCNTQSKGVGAWAYIIRKYDPKLKDYTSIKKDSNKVFNTTNNKMELEAMLKGISAIESLCDPSEDTVEIISDSMYVVKGSNEWLENWKKNEWKTISNKPVKNQDIWLKVIDIKNKFKKIKFTWVKGHDIDKFNIECDAMCQNKIKEGVKQVQDETLKK